MYGEPEDVFYLGEGGWLEFDDYHLYADVYFWVEKVISSVEVIPIGVFDLDSAPGSPPMFTAMWRKM